MALAVGSVANDLLMPARSSDPLLWYLAACPFLPQLSRSLSNSGYLELPDWRFRSAPKGSIRSLCSTHAGVPALSLDHDRRVQELCAVLTGLRLGLVGMS